MPITTRRRTGARTSLCAFVLAAVAAPAAPAQPPATDAPARVREWVARNEPRIVRDAMALYALPNVASDSVNIRRNAARLVELIEARGGTARLLESPSGGPPAVLGELRTPGATRTVVLYAHYDGQPVAGSTWTTGDPWRPTLRPFANGVPGAPVEVPPDGARVDPEWRIYARSASDDKGPIVAMLAALDALHAQNIQPSVNVKFFFEGEEEAGSSHLGALLRAHRDALSADVWVFADGPVHVSGAPQLVLGVRGVVGLNVTLFGASRALHSGHYGNWAPNPAVVLAHLITSMRDADGGIRIAGFADDVAAPTAAELAAAQRLSTTDDSVRRSLRLGGTEAADAATAARIMAPALNVRGIRAAGVGAASTNAIPTSATVSIDFRLVPRQTPERVRELVERHIRSLGYEVTADSAAAAAHAARDRVALLEWDGGYRAVRTSIDHPMARALADITARAYGRAPFIAPTLGGSLPMYLFDDILGAPLIVLPMVNADNNQHAPDENIRLRNLFDGIVLYALVMAQL